MEFHQQDCRENIELSQKNCSEIDGHLGIKYYEVVYTEIFEYNSIQCITSYFFTKIFEGPLDNPPDLTIYVLIQSITSSLSSLGKILALIGRRERAQSSAGWSSFPYDVRHRH